MGGEEHGKHMVVLGDPAVRSIVDPPGAWDQTFPLTPLQRDQVDAVVDGVMVAGSVLMDRVIFAAYGLSIVESSTINKRSAFLPEDGGVGFKAMHEVAKDIVRGCGRTDKVRRGNEETDMPSIDTAWLLHTATLYTQSASEQPRKS